MQKEIKQKKQDLGIFYTDQRIVNFVFDILKIWKEEEEKETGRWESKKHYPSVIDPAVGDGAFLKAAVHSGFTKTDYIFGLDIDEDAVKKWKQINLLKEFGGKEDELEAHFFHQNGLEKIHWEQHVKKYFNKLKKKDINAQQFNAVVGNPPYGGVGLGETELTDDLIAQLANFEILPDNVKNNLVFANTQSSLFNSDKLLTAIKPDAKQKIKSFSIEILFLERFIQLAKPGGWIAIIIPDGILTNSNSHYVREFISEKAKVEAIVSLPRDAFKNVGTSAKTSILFLQKYKEQEKKQKDYSVFLASADFLDEKNFDLIKDNYKNYYNKIMSKKNLVQITTDEKGREIVMIRVDKTLKELMEEKPASRWDPSYWHPVYEKIFSQIRKGFKILPLEDMLKEPIIAPDHVRASRGEKIGKGFFCEYRTLKDLTFTGLNYAEINYCTENAQQRLKRTQIKIGDILFAGSGVGAVGRLGLVERVSLKSCVGDLFIIRNPKVNFYYVYVYLLTEFGQSQIEKVFHGISSAKISTKEIGQIKVALVNDTIQQHIESEYKKMSVCHDKAMEAKKNNQEAEYKKNIETAEKMLKELIAKTEAVIRGERKDVV